MKKYGFTGETMEFEGHTLRRIYYLRNVSFMVNGDVYFLRNAPSMNKGDVGGWIESEHNLSHEGECFVGNEAKVFGHAKVMDNAGIIGDSIVKDNAQIKGSAVILDNAVVGADTIVADTGLIGGDSKIYFYAGYGYGEPNISGYSQITGKTIIEAMGIIRGHRIHDKELSGDLYWM